MKLRKLRKTFLYNRVSRVSTFPLILVNNKEKYQIDLYQTDSIALLISVNVKVNLKKSYRL